MRRALALSVALGGLGVAAADTSLHVTPPTGWSVDASEAAALAAKLGSLPRFGGAPAQVSAYVFVRPDARAALHVTVATAALAVRRGEAARAELDSFLAAPTRAQLTGAQPGVTRRAEQLDRSAHQITAELEWSDPLAGTSTRAALVIAADVATMIAVSAECITAEGTPAAVAQACAQTLATLDAGLPLDRRVAFALAPAGTPPPPDEEAAGPRASAMAARPAVAPATMSEGPRAPLPPIVLRPQVPRAHDRRPVYVGLGMVMLAALFWWNRRRRERLDQVAPGGDR